MREEGHSTAGSADTHAAAQHLHDEPEAQHQSGRHVHHARVDAERDHHQDLRAGEEQQIGAEHAGDRAACADHGHRRGGIGDGMAEHGEDAAQHIEDGKSDMPHRIFNIVAEDPQVQHVADQMHPASVQKHARDERDKGRRAVNLRRQCRIAEDRRWNGAEPVDEEFTGLRREERLVQIDQRTEHDEADGNDGSDVSGVIVA